MRSARKHGGPFARPDAVASRAPALGSSRAPSRWAQQARRARVTRLARVVLTQPSARAGPRGRGRPRPTDRATRSADSLLSGSGGATPVLCPQAFDRLFYLTPRELALPVPPLPDGIRDLVDAVRLLMRRHPVHRRQQFQPE